MQVKGEIMGNFNNKKIRESFKYAFQGIQYTLKTQRNMRIHFFAAAIVLAMSIFFQVPYYQLLLLLFSIVFVICMELMNTAIECTVDLITDKPHPLAKIAKDVAAGAVLLASFFAVIIGVYVFIDPILSLLSVPWTLRFEWFMAFIVLIFIGMIWLGKGRR